MSGTVGGGGGWRLLSLSIPLATGVGRFVGWGGAVGVSVFIFFRCMGDAVAFGPWSAAAVRGGCGLSASPWVGDA